MHTLARLGLVTLLSFSAACVGDSLADGEERWSFRLAALETTASCADVTRDLELIVKKRDEQTIEYALLADPRFEHMQMTWDPDTGSTDIVITDELSPFVEDHWELTLAPSTRDPSLLWGSAVQSRVRRDTNAELCATAYVTEVRIEQ